MRKQLGSRCCIVLVVSPCTMADHWINSVYVKADTARRILIQAFLIHYLIHICTYKISVQLINLVHKICNQTSRESLIHLLFLHCIGYISFEYYLWMSLARWTISSVSTVHFLISYDFRYFNVLLEEHQLPRKTWLKRQLGWLFLFPLAAKML